MAKTDIDDATGVTSQEAEQTERSTQNLMGSLLGAAALLYFRNQQQRRQRLNLVPPPEPVNVEVQPDIQDLGHPRPLSGGPEDLPPDEDNELPPAGGTTPPDETLHTAYRPESTAAAITLSVGSEQIQTDSERIGSDIEPLSNLDAVQRAIDGQPFPGDLPVEIQVEGERVFYQGAEGRYVHPDFDLAAARDLVVNQQRSGVSQDQVIDIDIGGPEPTPNVSEQAPNGVSPTGAGSTSSPPSQETLTTETVSLSEAEAIAGQNEGDASTDNPAILAAQPTTPTVTKDGRGRIVRSPSLERLDASADLVKRKESQREWAAMFDRCLEVTHGKGGSATIVGNRYNISRDGNGGLTVTAKDGRGVIFERDQSGKITSAANAQDLQTFAKGAAVLDRQQARTPALPSTRNRPSGRPSMAPSRRGGMEMG